MERAQGCAVRDRFDDRHQVPASQTGKACVNPGKVGLLRALPFASSDRGFTAAVAGPRPEGVNRGSVLHAGLSHATFVEA